MKEYLLGRIRLVHDLLHSDIAVHYNDLALILCAVLSACAAQRWPGSGVDRKRFVELLVKISPPDYHTDWVAVPALIADGLVDEKDTLYVANETRIFTDEEIDLPILDAATRYPQVDLKKLKTHTYASLIYVWLRNGYAHEYLANKNITHVQASRHQARVSYIGRGVLGGGIQRMTSFHLDYLIALAEYHASEVVKNPTTQPEKWWLE
jgi:hypothetical protein